MAVVLLLLATRSYAGAAGEWNEVLEVVDKIKAESAVNARTEDAEHLADLVRAKKGEKAPDKVIEALTGLMSDRHDSVRYWAAMALGYLGPQAVSAIPALRKALKDIEGVRASKTSESAIRNALEKIGGQKK